MSTKIYVNVPVKDLARSIDFYDRLGFPAHPQFTDERAAGVAISDDIYLMLLTEPFFQTFTRKEIVDATKGTETIVALGLDSRARVDELADKALAAGGQRANEPIEEGFMYGRSFQDPDGHIWELIYSEP
jgi:predicted lactoylglutathione lyase